MNRVVLFLFASMVSMNIFSTTFLNPDNLIKTETDYQLVWGEYEGQTLWAYSVGDDVKFYVVDALTPEVDSLITAAQLLDTVIEQKDEEVKWFCENGLIERNLVVVDN